MPTQEERLETAEYNLRQFKTETVRVYQDMAFEMTMVKGLTEDAIKRLAALRDTVEKRLDAVDERFSTIDQRFDAVDERFSTIDQRFDAVDERFSTIDQRFDAVDERFSTIDQRLGRLETKFDEHTALLIQILARLPEKPW